MTSQYNIIFAHLSLDPFGAPAPGEIKQAFSLPSKRQSQQTSSAFLFKKPL